jgi:hypothetical protein
MPRVALSFTANLRRHLAVPSLVVQANTVAEALCAVFAQNPALAGYLCDDQGRIRLHVSVFLNGEQIADRDTQSDPIVADAELYVMQALSGGA